LIEKIGSPEDIAELYTEENIEKKKTASTDEETVSYMDVKIITDKRQFRQNDEIKIAVSCSGLDEEAFLNVSFVYNGIVIADKNSKFNNTQEQIANDKTLFFSQNLENFNSGKYDLHLSLHNKKDNRLLEHKPRVFSFIIKGHDPSRDGPMKLNGAWTNKINEMDV
jgi:hypothetical protein